MTQTAFYILLNGLLIGGGGYLFFKKDLLGYFKGGQWWLTWLAIGVITLMDELTSIFYAPSEAYHDIGTAAIFFIPLTALFIHYMTTRMVEVAEILDFHGLKGGGVYNFSYLVLGPVISFVAVASIMVDYILTAAISTVSAIESISYSFGFSPGWKLVMSIGVIWAIAGLNIIGIRENMRVTFGIFLVTAIVFFNLIAAGIGYSGAENLSVIGSSVSATWGEMTSGGFFKGYAYLIAGLSSCILAYSGVESVMQTASLVQNWKVVARAYVFLALSVGLLTPIISILVLSNPHEDIGAHQTQLLPHFATLVGGDWFGIVIQLVATATLLMAMNTAYVASSELIERVAHRYGFHWIIQTNRHNSLYRIHIINAVCFSFIVLLTRGKQSMLADMYAIGLVATFVIHLATLLIYRYSKGTKEILSFNVTRSGTLVFFIIILSAFVYLSYHRPAGFILWFIAAAGSLLIGVFGTRKHAPEISQIERGENPMDIVFYIAENSSEHVHLYFKRPFDTPQEKSYDLPVFVTFYSPRQKIPPRSGENHFRIPFKRANIFNNIVAVLDLMVYELPHKNITVHFGWPTSSWMDRLSTGVMVFQFMRVPTLFPQVNFRIEQYKKTP